MIIYLDENMPRHLAEGFHTLQFPEGLKTKHLIEVKYIPAVFGAGAKDIDWIPKVGKEKACVITQDISINRRKHELELYKKHKIGMFFLRGPNRKQGLSIWQMVEALAKNWSAISQKVYDEKRPFATKLSYEIPRELKKYVVSIIEGKSESKLNTIYPVFAIGHPLMIYVYESMPIISVNDVETKPSSRVQIAGQIFDADISIKLQGKFGQIGLVLHPLTTYYLFHKPGSYFLNKWCNFQNALPIATNKDLHLALSACKTTDDRIKTLLEFLKSLLETKLPEIKWLETAIKKIYSLGGKITQEELSDRLDISLRHFRRKFKEVVGISPKHFCKIIQLNTVFEMLNNSDTERLHHLALDCGYYDQAHFIHDFEKMIGSSPRNFLEGNYSFVKEYMGKKTS